MKAVCIQTILDRGHEVAQPHAVGLSQDAPKGYQTVVSWDSKGICISPNSPPSRARCIPGPSRMGNWHLDRRRAHDIR